MAPKNNEEEESSKDARQRSKRRVGEQNAAHYGRGHPTECKPAYHLPVQLAAVEPGSTSVSNQLGDGKDWNCFSYSEDDYEHREKHSGATETRYGSECCSEKRHNREYDETNCPRHRDYLAGVHP